MKAEGTSKECAIAMALVSVVGLRRTYLPHYPRINQETCPPAPSNAMSPTPKKRSRDDESYGNDLTHAENASSKKLCGRKLPISEYVWIVEKLVLSSELLTYSALVCNHHRLLSR